MVPSASCRRMSAWDRAGSSGREGPAGCAACPNRLEFQSGVPGVQLLNLERLDTGRASEGSFEASVCGEPQPAARPPAATATPQYDPQQLRPAKSPLHARLTADDFVQDSAFSRARQILLCQLHIDECLPDVTVSERTA